MTDDAQPKITITPTFTITGGRPTDEEIAAVVAVLSARAAARVEPPAEPARSGWSAYWRTVGAPLQPGPGSWQAAYRR